MVALNFGVICYLLISSPATAVPLAGAVIYLKFGAVAVPVLCVWACKELFDDRCKLQLWYIIPVAIVLVPIWYGRGEIPPALAMVRGTTVAMLYVYLVYTAISTAVGDLVETRRSFRNWLVGLVAICGIVVVSFEVFFAGIELSPAFLSLHAAAILLLTGMFAIWSLRIREEVWINTAAADIADKSMLSPAESALLNRLNKSMQENAWKQEGLTIRLLAESLDAPEHRLRKVINSGLGYRNFAAFLNERRIKAASGILADPDRAEVSILSIAFDCGYASLGPFNRAFREIKGESPTEYRHRALDHTG